MNNPDQFDEPLKKIPNDLYISKFSFNGKPQPTEEALKVIGKVGIDKIDDFFKSRRRKKRLNKPGLSVVPKASSEIFYNEDNVGIYCFSGIFLPSEHYASPESIKTKDYTVMLLSELISEQINDILISPEINKLFEQKSLFQEGKRRRDRVSNIKKRQK